MGAGGNISATNRWVQCPVSSGGTRFEEPGSDPDPNCRMTTLCIMARGLLSQIHDCSILEGVVCPEVALFRWLFWVISVPEVWELLADPSGAQLRSRQYKTGSENLRLDQIFKVLLNSKSPSADFGTRQNAMEKMKNPLGSGVRRSQAGTPARHPRGAGGWTRLGDSQRVLTAPHAAGLLENVNSRCHG